MPDSEPVSVLLASQIITMDSGRPNARAVAVRGSRIVTVGSLEEVTSALGDEPFSIDRTHEHDVILPGLIDQHLHPFLGATTLTTEVIATEDWHLPSRTFPAANSESEYRARLAAADAAIEDPRRGCSRGAITRCGTARSTARCSIRSVPLVRSGSGRGPVTSST